MMSTERIRLRQLKLDDAHLLHLLNNDEGVMKYLDHQAPSLESVQKQTSEVINNYIHSPHLGIWIAETRPDSEFIGWFALSHCGLDIQKALKLNERSGADCVLEVGYRLRPKSWGMGLATEGCRMLIRYAFSLEKTKEVVGTTMFVNRGSRRVMEKAGMTFRNDFHVDFKNPLPGTEFGEVLYGISRKEWSESN